MPIILEHDGLVEYHSDFMSSLNAQHFFSVLENEIDWCSDQLVMFGKHITTKRKVAWYGDKSYVYIYSNTKKIATTWTPTLSLIKDQLETYTGERFNSCLLNLYHNGSEGMGWHSDDEIMMKKSATIASISLGAERTFSFQHKRSKAQHSIELENGSLLLMKGDTQYYWKHQLPARKRIQSPRINLTFRQFNTDTTT